MAALELSPNFGLVILTFVFSLAVHYGWMALRVGQARVQYRVYYPTLYAPADHEHAKKFNCIQRGHQNSLEWWPAHVALTLLVGVKYPLLATVTGNLYIISRILYFKGYSTGSPKGRFRGSTQYLATITQLVSLVVIAVQNLL